MTAAALCATAAAAAQAGDDDDLVDDAMSLPESEPMVVIRNLDANVDGWLFGNRRFGGSPNAKLTLLLKVRAEEIAPLPVYRNRRKTSCCLPVRGTFAASSIASTKSNSSFAARKCPRRIGIASLRRFSRFAKSRPPQRPVRDAVVPENRRTTLTAEQAARYEKGESDRRAFQHRTRIVSTVARLSDYLGLSDAQRKRLVEVTLEKTQPLPLLDQTDRDQLVGLALMSRVPETDIRPIFDNDQSAQAQASVRARCRKRCPCCGKRH